MVRWDRVRLLSGVLFGVFLASSLALWRCGAAAPATFCWLTAVFMAFVALAVRDE